MVRFLVEEASERMFGIAVFAYFEETLGVECEEFAFEGRVLLANE
jgi:hypothetical protein